MRDFEIDEDDISIGDFSVSLRFKMNGYGAQVEVDDDDLLLGVVLRLPSFQTLGVNDIDEDDLPFESLKLLLGYRVQEERKKYLQEDLYIEIDEVTCLYLEKFNLFDTQRHKKLTVQISSNDIYSQYNLCK